MSLSILKIVFTVLLIGIIYIIIFISLKLMYKDFKGENKNRIKKTLGLEVIRGTSDADFKKGAVIPLYEKTTIGRQGNNTIVIDNPYVSKIHAVIYVRNNDYYLEDNNSTNGIILNGERIIGTVKLKKNDEISIGRVIFKVIG
ncbi:MAG: FHA domain-containing protein [Clostridiaceae bacterium]